MCLANSFLVLLCFGVVLCIADSHPFLYYTSTDISNLRTFCVSTTPLTEFNNLIPATTCSGMIWSANVFLTTPLHYDVEHLCRDGTSGTVDFVYDLSDTQPGPELENACGICCPWTSITGSIETRLDYYSFAYTVTGIKI